MQSRHSSEHVVSEVEDNNNEIVAYLVEQVQHTSLLR